MSQLTILDLNFCESQLPDNRQVGGGTGFGITVNSPTGSFSTSVDSSNSSGYYTDYFFDRNTGAFGYLIAYAYSGAAAGAVAGAAGDGSTYVSSYASASTS